MDNGLPSPFAVFVAVPIVAFGVTASLLVIMLQLRRKRATLPRRGYWFSTSAVLVGLMAVGVYLVGLSYFVYMDESIADDRCKDRLSPAEAMTQVGYHVDFLPLRFACRLVDGREVSTTIPGFINPTLAALSVSGIILGLVGRAESEAV